MNTKTYHEQQLRSVISDAVSYPVDSDGYPNVIHLKVRANNSNTKWLDITTVQALAIKKILED